MNALSSSAMNQNLPDLATVEAPLRGLIHSLHRETLRERVEKLRWSRKFAARKSHRGTKEVAE
jgi:hypothetical protein